MIHAISLGTYSLCSAGPRRVAIYKLVIPYTKNKLYQDAPGHVANHQLQKAEVLLIGQARNADDGERTCLRRYDQQRNSPPRNGVIRKNLIFEGPLFPAEAQAEQCYPH
jgi:hypothetical protein